MVLMNFAHFYAKTITNGNLICCFDTFTLAEFHALLTSNCFNFLEFRFIILFYFSNKV